MDAVSEGGADAEKKPVPDAAPAEAAVPAETAKADEPVEPENPTPPTPAPDPAVGKNIDLTVDDAEAPLDQSPKNDYKESREKQTGFVPLSFGNIADVSHGNASSAGPVMDHSAQDMAKAIQTELRHDKNEG
jgi:hypothetical protein